MRNIDLPTLSIGKSLDLPYDLKEAFNSLRINLNFAAEDAKVVMVTSSIAGEGKSFVSMQIMKMFAESGKRVCLIDTDMRRSALLKEYLISSDKNIVGLSHYLSGQSSFADILYRVENIDRAYMICCGAYVIDPTNLLENKRFEILMDNVKNNFDFVIVDCAPIGLVSDAKFISKYCNGTLMVIKSNALTRQVVMNSARQIEESGCRLIGYILNRKKKTDSTYYSKRYERYDSYKSYGANESGNDDVKKHSKSSARTRKK